MKKLTDTLKPAAEAHASTPIPSSRKLSNRCHRCTSSPRATSSSTVSRGEQMLCERNKRWVPVEGVTGASGVS